MSQYVDGNCKTLVAGEAINAFLRVKLHTDGTAMIAGLAEKDIGTAEHYAASGDRLMVRLRTASGTAKMVAKEAISVASPVYTEAGGKVQDTNESTSFLVGIAMEAASADNDVIEVLRNAHGDTANA